MKFMGLVSSVNLATALINSKDYVAGRQELDRALNASEKMGTRVQTAAIHSSLGEIALKTGDAAGAVTQHKQATALLDEIKKEPGAERIMERVDLKAIYNDAAQVSAKR